MFLYNADSFGLLWTVGRPSRVSACVAVSVRGCRPTDCDSTRRKPTFCDLLRLINSTRFQTICRCWAWIPFNQSNLSVISVFTLIQIFRCGNISHKLYPAASQFYAKFAASVDRSYSYSLCHSHSLVLSRFDYRGATLACLPARLFERLQAVLNSRARLHGHASMDPWLGFYMTCIVSYSGMYHVSTRGTSVPLSAWTCATVPCWWTSKFF